MKKSSSVGGPCKKVYNINPSRPRAEEGGSVNPNVMRLLAKRGKSPRHCPCLSVRTSGCRCWSDPQLGSRRTEAVTLGAQRDTEVGAQPQPKGEGIRKGFSRITVSTVSLRLCLINFGLSGFIIVTRPIIGAIKLLNY